VELLHKISIMTAEDKLRQPGAVLFSSLDEKIKAIDVELSNMPEGSPQRHEKIAQRDALYKERYPEKVE